MQDYLILKIRNEIAIDIVTFYEIAAWNFRPNLEQLPSWHLRSRNIRDRIIQSQLMPRSYQWLGSCAYQKDGQA